MHLHPLVKTITESELRFIASGDYGENWDRHVESLRSVIFDQDGRFSSDQSWFPLEVVELGAYSLERGHEREFFFCTTLVLLAVHQGVSSVDPEMLLSSIGHHYDQLEPELREEVLRAFERVRA
jgi:hypothetical protein